MRSKKKKLFFICFSALIMVGLMIGVFADYNDDRVGTVVGSKPFDLGEKIYDVSDVDQSDLTGYFIVELTINETPSLYNQNLSLLNINGNYFMVYYADGVYRVRYNSSDDMVDIDINVGDTVYVYCYYSNVINPVYSSYNTNGQYVSMSIYNISDSYTIDIYDNSQDVWASVVSVVTDATDSVINNDILLLFAAAVPVISFGVGMLIRLYHKS